MTGDSVVKTLLILFGACVWVVLCAFAVLAGFVWLVAHG